jgi:hypothetical protein
MSRRLLGITIALTCAAAGLTGCSARPLDATGAAGIGGSNLGGASGGGTGASGGGGFVPNRNVDILFLIDDSALMTQAQNKLVRSFPQFISGLQALPRGLPNLHIAVVSSDMGAGDGSISGCNGEGKAGVFQSAARRDCTATNLAPGATYISIIGGVANYTGTLEDVFACIAPLGETGCGFEHQLSAVARALGADGRPPPSENLGFLRDDALLAIVLLTNEDDCSTPPGSPLFDTTDSLKLESAVGPPGNFRCNEFGHLCGGNRPPRFAPTGSLTDTVTLEDCVPAEASGMLTPVATLVAQLRALKADPDRQIMVSAISGPTTPYTVHWKNPAVADTGLWPEMSHACVAADASQADPAVRIGAFVDAFGDDGVRLSICSDVFSPALQAIAGKIAERVRP